MTDTDWKKYERSPADKSRSAKMKKYWEMVHGKKLVGPVDLHLTRTDADILKVLVYSTYTYYKPNEFPSYEPPRKRILNKLKREGVK